MRTITLIVIHSFVVMPGQTSSAAQIDFWHRQLGWKLGIGYPQESMLTYNPKGCQKEALISPDFAYLA